MFMGRSRAMYAKGLRRGFGIVRWIVRRGNLSDKGPCVGNAAIILTMISSFQIPHCILILQFLQPSAACTRGVIATAVPMCILDETLGHEICRLRPPTMQRTRNNEARLCCSTTLHDILKHSSEALGRPYVALR